MRKVYVGEDYEGKDHVAGVYCSGNLEDEAGYDFVFVDDINELDTSEHIEDVVAILPNGEERAARLFIWHRDFPGLGLGGFVVETDDKDYLEFAKQKFDQRAEYI